jgi:hypothetical protein
MAAFPSSIIPSTRAYSPGAFPHTVHGVYDGSEVRVRHSNTALGVRLRLFFPAITTAELLSVISHYSGQRGRFLPFAIPNDLLSGVTTPAGFTPAGHQWRYSARPTVEDISIVGGTNRHNLTIELETVPPENTIAQGARLRVRSSLQAGSAQLGEFFDVYAWLDAGAAIANLALGAEITATASLAAGAGSAEGGAPTDPYFANVSLLLPMNGTNGSTTFTDASSNTLTVTVSGSAQISTAQSKWGGASGLFAGDGDHLAATLATALSTGAYTVECWAYITSRPTNTHIASIGDYRYATGIQFYLNTSGYIGSFGDNGGVSILGATAAALNTWHHLAWVQNGSTLTQYLNGTQDGSATSTLNLSDAIVRIAANYYDGAHRTGGGNVQGHLDDFRLTRGVARWTANFTPPAAAFPTSGPPATDADADAYIAAVEAADGASLESGVKTAIQTFVAGCKTDGIWDDIKSSCILAGARTLTGALVPLKGSAPTNNNFVSGDYNRKTGLIGNGSSKYLDSNRANNADPQDDAHLAIYVSVAGSVASGALDIYAGGGNADGLSYSYLEIGSANNESGIFTGLTAYNRTADFASIGSYTATGFMGCTRSASGSFTGRVGGSNTTVSQTSKIPAAFDIAIFADNSSGTIGYYSDPRIAFYSIGENLSLSLLDARVTQLIGDYAAAIP